MPLLEGRHHRRQAGLRKLPFEFLCGRSGGGDLVLRCPHVECKRRGHDADQHEHDQAHPLLAVVRSVGETHPRAGADQEGTNPPGWRLVTVGWLVEFLGRDQSLREHQQQRCQAEADHGRDHQRDPYLGRLVPVDPLERGAAFHPGVHHPHADDRADERVGTRSRQTTVPGGEVPDDRGPEQREHHRQAAAGLDVDQQVDRQQVNDAEGHADAAGMDADEVPEARPDDGRRRLQALGVDHRGHGVGRVVEAVDALESEGDHQRRHEQCQLAG